MANAKDLATGARRMVFMMVQQFTSFFIRNKDMVLQQKILGLQNIIMTLGFY